MEVGNFVGVSNGIKTTVKMSMIALALAYFGYHAISGENGFLSYMRIKKQYLMQSEILIDLKEKFCNMERDVKLISDKSLDIDLLEERCRIVLNYSDANDCIIKE